MNRHVRPFGLKLGPFQAGAFYFPLHFLAVGVGFSLFNAQQGVGVFWPATGVLFAFLLLYPPRFWPALLAFGFLSEILANEVFAPSGLAYTMSGLLFFVKFASALLGVGLMHVAVRGPISFARLHQVLGFAASAAVSTLVCAVIAVSLRNGVTAGNLELWLAAVQSWWIGDFLGAVIVTPLILTIGFHGITVTSSMRGGRAATYSAFAVLLLLLAAVFLHAKTSRASPLDVPYIVYPVLVWIGMVGGPRRTALAAGITVGLAALATTRGFGPFSNTYELQTFLALCVLPVLLLQAVMAERDVAIENARGSDERYRAFVANSSEAIFRTEMAEPMPVTLSPDEQVAWVRKHGYVAECNAAFMVALGIKDRPAPSSARASRTIPPGRGSTSSASASAIRNNYQLRNIEHVVHGPYGLDRVLLISMVGIVENGHVLRFWGTGRDVTAMREAENALAQHDAQLRALATEITLAEERARRKLASELHDGPAQNLTGMSLTLAAMKRSLTDRDAARTHGRDRTGAGRHHDADAHPDARTGAARAARERARRSAALAGRSRAPAAAPAWSRSRTTECPSRSKTP